MIFFQNFRSDDVTGHQIRCKLNALEAHFHYLRKGFHHQRFCQTRNTFEQTVTASQQRNDHLIQHFFLSDDDFSNFFFQLGKLIYQVLVVF